MSFDENSLFFFNKVKAWSGSKFFFCNRYGSFDILMQIRTPL